MMCAFAAEKVVDLIQNDDEYTLPPEAAALLRVPSIFRGNDLIPDSLVREVLDDRCGLTGACFTDHNGGVTAKEFIGITNSLIHAANTNKVDFIANDRFLSIVK